MTTEPDTSQGPLLLRSVKVSGLRSLLATPSIPLQPEMTVLTGQNDGGKSTLVDALSILLDRWQPPEESRAHGIPDTEDIVVAAQFVDASEPISGQAVAIRAVVPRSGTVRREVAERVHPSLGRHPVDLQLQVLRAKLAELNVALASGADARQKEPYVSALEQWVAEQPPDSLEETWQPLSGALEARLPRLTVFKSTRTQDPEQHIATLVASEARRLIAEDRYADSLSAVEDQLNEDIQGAVERIREAIMRYVDGLEDITVQASFDFSRAAPQVSSSVQEHGRLTRFSELGDGRRRRMTLAIHEAGLGFMSREELPGSELVVYDEPDTHLDYVSQRQLFDILTAQSRIEHVQVVVATHSANFIDKVSIGSLVHLRLDDERRTTVERLELSTDEEDERFLESLAAGIGPRNSMLLGERQFFIVEGATEARALPIVFRRLYEKSLVASGVGLIDAEGSSAARKIAEVLVTQWNRGMIVLVDNDARGQSSRMNTQWLTRNGFIEDETVFFIGTKEFEDAFTDEVWLRVAERHYAPVDGSPAWQLDDFAALRGGDLGYGAQLVNLLYRRCQRKITKPELGEVLAHEIVLPDELPEAAANCLNALRQLALRD